MASQNKPIKCHCCKVAAQVVVEHGEPKRVTCPRCGRSRDYTVVRRMIGEQASAFAAEKLQESFQRTFRKGRSGGVSSRHSPTHTRQPIGNLFVDF